MSGSDNGDAVARFFEAHHANDWASMRKLYATNAVQEWPQSGERLKGVDNIMAVNENYPSEHPQIGQTRISASADLVIGEADLDYSGTRYHLVSVFEFEDGLIKRETDYFCEPFEAEAWRAQWVEGA